MSNFSENLKKLRKQKKFTQENFSELLGIKRNTYAAYEEGRSEPPLDILLSISQILRHRDIYSLIASKDLKTGKIPCRAEKTIIQVKKLLRYY
jgi:transcriptional regulator with XRE-family HTH domain